MTILKNKRRTSRIEYERTFLSLYEYMTGLIDNFPRRYMEPLGKLTKGFTFLKVRYHASGEKTIKTLAKSGIVRMRRKLKKFGGLMARNMMRRNDVYASIQSWITHARVASSYHAVKAMLALYDMMYEGYRLTRRYWKRNEDLHRKRKVVRI